MNFFLTASDRALASEMTQSSLVQFLKSLPPRLNARTLSIEQIPAGFWRSIWVYQWRSTVRLDGRVSIGSNEAQGTHPCVDISHVQESFVLKLTCLTGVVTAFAMVAGSMAQSLPPPSRTVFKCEEGGRVRYSDAPCLGATKIDIEPTRGMNKSSGSERTGPDVYRERQREIFAEAVRPLTGMDRKQLDQAALRSKLTPAVQRECQRLDREILTAEQAERTVSSQGQRSAAQARTFDLRKSSRGFGCS